MRHLSTLCASVLVFLVLLLPACSDDPTQPVAPTLTTAPITEVTFNSAIGGGEVLTNGRPPVTARGICWSTSNEPTIDDNKTVEGAGVGAFSSAMENLEVSTTYFVRAYATNATATAYGEEVSFITAPGDLPTVISVSISNVTQVSANAFVEFGSDGGSTITERGICWSTAQQPTISDSKNSTINGFGQFSMTNLTAGTTYYVRGYAINSTGISYSPQTSLTTSP